eukprot:TRINITY_DN4389_c0_g1_i5.p1 TRINITY_DN4389_c0_g1~~TRINITY_DN4389_c0_g1_i5.p1  ORF type:complete len:922 (-),score=169.40 TRINITY_DN4389_c0_g1_i5:71-2836(-)
MQSPQDLLPPLPPQQLNLFGQPRRSLPPPPGPWPTPSNPPSPKLSPRQPCRTRPACCSSRDDQQSCPHSNGCQRQSVLYGNPTAYSPNATVQWPQTASRPQAASPPRTRLPDMPQACPQYFDICTAVEGLPRQIVSEPIAAPREPVTRDLHMAAMPRSARPPVIDTVTDYLQTHTHPQGQQEIPVANTQSANRQQQQQQQQQMRPCQVPSEQLHQQQLQQEYQQQLTHMQLRQHQQRQEMQHLGRQREHDEVDRLSTLSTLSDEELQQRLPGLQIHRDEQLRHQGELRLRRDDDTQSLQGERLFHSRPEPRPLTAFQQPAPSLTGPTGPPRSFSPNRRRSTTVLGTSEEHEMQLMQVTRCPSEPPKKRGSANLPQSSLRVRSSSGLRMMPQLPAEVLQGQVLPVSFSAGDSSISTADCSQEATPAQRLQLGREQFAEPPLQQFFETAPEPGSEPHDQFRAGSEPHEQFGAGTPRLGRHGRQTLESSEVLGVEPDATPRQLRAVYRQRVLQAHPDKGGEAAEFRKVHSAYGYMSAKRRGSSKSADHSTQRASPEAADHSARRGSVALAAVDEECMSSQNDAAPLSAMQAHHSLPLGAGRMRQCSLSEPLQVWNEQQDASEVASTGSSMWEDPTAISLQHQIAAAQGFDVHPAALSVCRASAGQAAIDQQFTPLVPQLSAPARQADMHLPGASRSSSADLPTLLKGLAAGRAEQPAKEELRQLAHTGTAEEFQQPPQLPPRESFQCCALPGRSTSEQYQQKPQQETQQRRTVSGPCGRAAQSTPRQSRSIWQRSSLPHPPSSLDVQSEHTLQQSQEGRHAQALPASSREFGSTPVVQGRRQLPAAPAEGVAKAVEEAGQQLQSLGRQRRAAIGELLEKLHGAEQNCAGLSEYYMHLASLDAQLGQEALALRGAFAAEREALAP